jgi:gamma-glutamyltranspeptidase/glutathione hydrolase
MRLVFLSILFLTGTLSYAQVRYNEGRYFSSRSEVLGEHGMVATSQPLATQAALEVLKQGGTAIDAAIAANCMLGLMEPTGNGMGGDLFAIIWDAKTQKLYGLNGSGRSPKSLPLAWFSQHGYKKIPNYGALSVSVPGCVDAWYTLHERFGKLPMERLLRPTIDYAANGFPVTEVIAHSWAGYAVTLNKYAGYRRTYMPGGKTPHKGEIFRNPALAHTLELLVKGGRDAFYKGPVADSIEKTVHAEGGFLSREDMAAHHSEWVEPISTNYRGYDVWELPPNTHGLAVLEMLNILENFDIRGMGFGSADYMHRFIETKKLVYEDRAKFYADPDYYKVPLKGLLSKEYAAKRSRLIDPAHALDSLYAGDPSEFGNTIYLTVADQYGNMVSFIQSNFAGMGSGIIPDGCGFSLQNRGCAFNLQSGLPDTYAPGKRPFHTLIPGFVTRNGQPWLSFGVMGADMQPLGQVQVLVNLIDFGMGLQEAGDAARINHVGSSTPEGDGAKGKGTVFLEEGGFTPLAVAELQRMGHVIGHDLTGYGGFQGIIRDTVNHVYHGASEFRKDGNAAGY